MKCPSTTEELSALLDGDLPPRRAAVVQAHVDGCDACHRELAELSSLRASLSEELAHPSLPPDRDGDGWAALAARLGPSPDVAPSRRFRWRWVLAPAMVLACTLGGAAWVLRHQGGPSDDQLIAQAEDEFRKADVQYLRAIEKLRSVTQSARVAWPEGRRKEYDAAQASLESATEQCRLVARARPADPDAEELLFAAYRKQISFLQGQLLQREVAR
jgi:hypothetical protein